jgi:ABC-type nitrate/sulfonate/bicarbonate transport system permease component
MTSVQGRNGQGRWLVPGSTALRVVAYIVVFGSIWEVATVLLRPPDYLLPPLHSVLAYCFAQWEVMLKHAGVTAHETLLGFAESV